MNDGHHPTVVKNYGVQPDVAGTQAALVRGFRAHCPDCGALGTLRDNILTAQGDRDAHRAGRLFPKPRGLSGC